jgi:amino acid adenylation domain-containing protein
MEFISKIKDIYPLSPMQEGFIFHALLDESSSYYFEQISYRFHGRLNVSAVKESLKLLFERHDILRTSFTYDTTERPLQVVFQEREICFYFEDRRSHDFDEAAAAVWLEEFRKADRNKPFNLKKDTLLRTAIIQIEENVYEIIWSFHHIILDGWSLGILNSEFWEIYTSLANGKKPILAFTRQFKDYIKWLEKKDKSVSKDFWDKQMLGYSENIEIPKKTFSQNKSQVYVIQELLFQLDSIQSKKLQGFAKTNNVTLYTVVQAIWGVLLARYNDTRDIVLGTVVSGRPAELQGIESITGLFINTVPLRIKYDTGTNFKTLIQQLKVNALEAEAHHHYPFVEIQADGQAIKELISHILIFENYPISASVKREESEEDIFQITDVYKYTNTNYDLNVLIIPGDRLEIRFNYNSNVYDENSIKRIITHIDMIINQIIDSDEIKIDDILIVSPEERHQLLFDFNNTKGEYPSDKTIQELFELQTIQNPDALAIVFEHQSMSYSVLNEQANQLANYLRTVFNVQPGNLIAIIADPGIYMVVGLLGILKSGAAYVPIDPQNPKERIDFLLNDIKSRIVLTDRELLYTDPAVATIFLNENASWRTYDKQNPQKTNVSADLAYVIYTSGSTGQPKGVMVAHQGVINRIYWMWKQYNFSVQDVVLQKTPYVFDVSVWEFFMTLCFGARLILCKKELIFNPEQIAGHIEDYGITTIHFVPSMLNKFIAAIDDTIKTKLKKLRHIIASGEALLEETVKQHYQKLAIPLHNLYGPTEASVDVSYYQTSSSDHIIPIGKPILNINLYITDKNLQLVPVGVPGEILIAGIGLAKGYLNRTDLTENRFIPHPFKAGQVVYKTGDSGRWLDDGTIEYLGRKDSQVKIRGYRIELGEIENVLLGYDTIEKTVVIDVEDQEKDKYLVAYYESTDECDSGLLRNYLKITLPEYMIPVFFIKLDKIPLTASCKIDRKALPHPDRMIRTHSRTMALPVNEIQRHLKQIWQGVLATDQISIYDNFFEIGGHSLKAIKLVSRINNILKVKIGIKNIFINPTIEKLAKLIQEAAYVVYDEIVPVGEQEHYEVSHAQKRLWILAQLEEDQTTYNVPVVYHFEEEINKKAIEKAFGILISRHESLRTTFVKIDGEPRQRVNSSVSFNFKINYDDLRAKENKQILAAEIASKEAMACFDLASGPLLRLKLVQLDEKHNLFLLTMHHIISDFVSMQILMKELISLYHSCKSGSGTKLLPLKIQYKDYAAWQNNLLKDGHVNKHKDFWLKQLQGEIPVLKFLTDYPRPAKLTNNGKFLNFSFDRPLTEKIMKINSELGSTTFITLLTVTYILLYKYNNQKDLIIGTPVAGRDHTNLENQIGFFVNMLPLRCILTGKETFRDLLKNVKNNTLNALTHQLYPFDLIVSDSNLKRDRSRNPLFDIVVTTDILDPETEFGEGNNEEMEKSYGICKYDIRVRFSEIKDQIAVNILYNKDLFKAERMLIFKERLITLTNEIAEDPDLILDRYNWAMEAQQVQQTDMIQPDFGF